MEPTANHAPVAGVRKIAVLRANSLGDFVFTLPALSALRSAYPDAEIVLLAREWHRAFLTERPGPFDRIVPIPSVPGVTQAAHEPADEDELARFFAAMRAEEFDLAVQLHGGGAYSNPFVAELGAGVTVGLRAPGARELDRCVPYVYYHHEVLRYLEVVSLVGARAPAIDPTLAVTERDLAEARSVVSDRRRPLVALHPGAADPRRRWPPERFAAVGDALARAGADVLVTGTEDERELVDSVVRAMEEEARPLAGRLSLRGLAGLLARCAVVVSNDTGPLHLARAVGAATVGIYWCGNMINGGPLTRSRHRALLSWTVRCPVCGADAAYVSDAPGGQRERCPHDPSFVAEVPVADVRFAALELLAPDSGRSDEERDRVWEQVA